MSSQFLPITEGSISSNVVLPPRETLGAEPVRERGVAHAEEGAHARGRAAGRRLERPHPREPARRSTALEPQEEQLRLVVERVAGRKDQC